MSLYEEYPSRIYRVYSRGADECVGEYKTLDGVLAAYPEIVDYWMNFRVEELWNGEVVRLWRPEVVERIDWKIV